MSNHPIQTSVVRTFVVRAIAIGALSATCVCSSGIAVLAQSTERRAGSPDYLHARSDLYKAETLMRAPADGRNVKREENAAVGFIAAAIRSINRAARIEDDNTAIDPAPNVPRGERLKNSEHLLDDAWNELKAPESDGRALAARENAVQNVRDAQNRVLRAEQFDSQDGAH